MSELTRVVVMADTRNYRRALAKVLKTMDKARITAFFEQNGVPHPDDEDTFWQSVHKARTMLPPSSYWPLIEIKKSVDWLNERELRHYATADVLARIARLSS